MQAPRGRKDAHLRPAECSCQRARHASCTRLGQPQTWRKGAFSTPSKQIQQMSLSSLTEELGLHDSWASILYAMRKTVATSPCSCYSLSKAAAGHVQSRTTQRIQYHRALTEGLNAIRWASSPCLPARHNPVTFSHLVLPPAHSLLSLGF